MPDHSDPFDLRSRGISDERVLAAMARVPREAFVPPEYLADARADGPLPIGCGQTISQPFVVAWMTQELNVRPGARVLEIGTGSGYQAAILADLGAEVWSIEVVPALADAARERLSRLEYGRIHLRTGSGYDGWPEEAPFDRILLTAAPPEVPPALLAQLADAGRFLAPIGVDWQVIVIVDRQGDRLISRESIPVRFVPMV